MGALSDYYKYKNNSNNTESGESKKKKSGALSEYYAFSFGASIPSRLEALTKQGSDAYNTYKSRFFDENGEFINSYRGDTEAAYNDYSTFKSNYDTESKAILEHLDRYGDNYDAKTVSEIRDYLTSNSKAYEDMLNAYKDDNDYWSQFDSEEHYNLLKMSSDEISPHLDNSKNSEKDKNIVFELQQTLVPYNKDTALRAGFTEEEYNDIDSKRKYIGEKYGVNLYDDVYNNVNILNDISRRLETSHIAYTTKGGQNITWQDLYDNSYANEDLERKYTAYSSLPDWAEKSKGIDGVLDTETDYMIAMELQNTMMPYDKKIAISNGYTEEEFNAVDNKRKYISEKYGVDLYSDIYNNINVLNDIMNKLDSVKGEKETFDLMSYMTEKEKEVFNYIYHNEGRNAALEWHNGRRGLLLDRYNNTLVKSMSDYADEHPVAASALSVVLNMYSGVEFITDSVSGMVTGQEQTNSSALASSSIRSAVSEKVDWEIGNWDAFDFVYNTGMSGIDSLASTFTFGKLGGLALGLSAAGQATNDALSRGMSKNKAFWNGLVAGVLECLFESWSIGNFEALKESVVKGGKTVAKNLAKTMLVNATEETLTEISNIAYDYFVNADFSQIETSIRQNIANGLTEKQAKSQAALSAAGQVVEAGASGALMGFGFGVTGNALGYMNYKQASNQITNQKGERVLSNGGVDTLKELALQYAEELGGTKGGKITKQANAITTDSNAKKVGKLFEVIGDGKVRLNKSGLTSSLVERGISKEKAENYANILLTMNEDFFAGKESNFNLGTEEQWKRLTGDENAFGILSDVVSARDKQYALSSIGIRVGKDGKINIKDIIAYQERSKAKETAGGLATDVENKQEVSDDGKTYAEVDGEQVEVTKKLFVNGEDGTLKVKVNDDKVVDAKNVSYGDIGEAYVVSTLVDLGVSADDANALHSMFDGVGENSGKQFASGISLAFKYGRYLQSTSNLANIVGITKAQAKTAYNLGKLSRKTEAKSAKANMNEVAETNEKEGKKAQTKGSVVFEGDIADENGNLAAGEDSLTDIQKASVDGVKLLAELTTINFHIFQSTKDGNTFTYVKQNGKKTHANGWYVVGTNDIYIDLNAGADGQGAMMYTAAHEIGHFIKQFSSEKWEDIAEFVMNWYTSHYGGDVETLLLRQITKVKNRPDSKNKTQRQIEDEAFEELVCDSLSKMLIDGTVVEAMADIKKKNKGLWNTIKEAVMKLLEKWSAIINQYKDKNPDAEEAAYFKETSKAFKDLQRLFTEAFSDASETYSKVGNVEKAQQETLSDRDSAEESKAIEAFGKDLGKVERNSDGDMLIATNEDNSTVMYSERTWNEGGKDKFISLMETLGHGDQAQEYAKYLDDALDYLHELAVGYEILGQHLDATITTDIKNGKQVLSAIVNNGEYPVNIDLALICKKRVAYMRLMAKMIEDGVFGDVKYDGDAIAEVNGILRKNGFETACLGCFVESRRLQFQTWAETIVQEWNEAVESRNKNAHYFRFADGKAALTDAEIEALDKELASGGEKNAKGNLNLGKGSVELKMGRLLDKVPSLARKLTVDDLLTPQGLTALRATDANLFSLVKQRYGAASPKIVQDYNPYASEIADLTFNFVKNITGNAVKGAQDYIKAAKKEVGDAPKKMKGESKEDLAKRKAEYNTKVEALAMRKYLYSIGGARIQSFSDFMIENVFDYLQIFADLSAKELPMHGYTKEIAALRLFGMTGAKWNGSLIAHVEKSMGKEYAGLLPASEAKNGNGILVKVDGKEYCIAFDDFARNKATNGKSFIQSIGMKDIIALMYDPRYSPYVGNITIGVSDKQIMAMLDSPLFRMVIPYHASGMLPQFAQLVGVDMYNDYTNYQNTTVKEVRLLDGVPYRVEIGDTGKPVVKNEAGDKIAIDTHYAFNENLQKYGDARKTCYDYLAWCRNDHPIYDKGKLIGYATFNPKFSDSPTGVDFTKHRNYYKLIEDFNCYDNITEKTAQQGAVTMTFPSKENRLSAEQKKAYEKALRDTGIFTDADIKKYLEKADMTFEDIVRAEVGNRKAYNDAQEPKFQSTVKEVEDFLLNAKDEKGNYKFRRDAYADTASDYLEGKKSGISLKPAQGSYLDEVEKFSSEQGWEKLSDRSDIRSFDHSDEAIARNVELVAGIDSVHDVPTSALEDSGKTIKEIYESFFNDWGGELFSEELGAIDVKTSSIRSERRHGSTAEKIAAIEAIPDVISNGKVVFAGEKDKGRILRIVVCAPIKIANKPYYMGVMVQRDTKHQRLYLHDVAIEKETSTSSLDVLLTTGSNEENERLFVTTILQKALNVKYNTKKEKLSDRTKAQLDYVEIASKAVMTTDRIDYLIEDSGAGSRVDYANYWITSISPTDFLNMTLPLNKQDRSAFDKFPSEWNENSNMDTYDYMGELKKNMRQTPYLAIDITTGKVVGHEGRHRIRALERDGIKSVEIRVEFRDEDGRTVKYSPDGKRLQVKDAVEIINQFGTGQTTSITNVIPLNKDYRDTILDNYGEATSTSEEDIRYSDRDSEGNTLTKEQQEFFKDSKVRDANGNLLVTYHGTPNDMFYVFDPSKQGSTTDADVWGKGFYFSDEKSSYYWNGITNAKNSLVCYLNIKKPFRVYTEEKVPDDFKEHVMSTNKYKNSDQRTKDWLGDGASRWYNFLRHSTEKGVDVNEILKSLGYDGIIVGTDNAEIVIFDSNQAKLTTNTNPTEDPDVRYSGRDTAVFDGKPFWSGSVSLVDGVIEEVHSYSEAEFAGFHHSLYFSQAQVEKMDRGENAFFWVDDGTIYGDWRESIPESFINKIEKQISITPSDPNIRYSDRTTTSTRSLLANALESTIDTSTPEGQIELKKLNEYKDMVGTLDELTTKLNELRSSLFKKGITGEERRKIQDEATKTANRISVYDKKLLTLEASKPLKKVLDREKAQAAKRQKAKDAEAFKAYKDDMKKKQKEREEQLKESRKVAFDKVIETRNKNEAKAKLQKLVLETAKWISYPKKGDVKCPDILRVPYADFLNGIDFSSKTLLEKGEQTKNDYRMALAMDSLATAIERVKNAQNPATDSDEVLDSGYLDLPTYFVDQLREMAEKTKEMILEGDFVINKMSSDDIKQLSKLINTLNHSIREMSTLYANMRFARVEELGDSSISFMEALGDANGTNAFGDFVTWDNALPYYAFKRFGESGESVFEELMDSQDKLAFLSKIILDFSEKAWTSKEAQAWSEDTHTIELPSGRTLTLTTADAMSIYCTARRDNNQGLNHLVGGGVRVLGEKKGVKEAKDSKANLDLYDVQAICDSLDSRQKEVAENIQDFMSSVCSEWGNEISMKRFLTKDFTEKRYFPIQSNDEVLAEKDPQAQQSDLYRLLNISATKPLTPKANNSVIIRNIFDVFTEHTSDMARLNAYGMALLDYMKWINYNEKTTNDDGQISVRGVRSAMNNAYGKKARSYAINLIKDINGRFTDGGDHPWLMKMTRQAKTAMVGANLRVAILQGTAYPRAAMVLSTGDLAKGLMRKPQISKAKKYCGIALWKSFGFYDTNISRSIEDQIKGTTNWRQKLIELSLKGAEWGDSITWGFLWNACEYEVARDNKQLKVGSEEFNEAVGKKLREVVYATQVVDSTLTRSQIMRNKSGLTQAVTAFMSEATVSTNILMDAGFQFTLEKRRTGSAKAAWKKVGGYVGKAITVYSVSQLLAALAEGLMDAYRDDDDEEFLDKFGEAFLENAITDIVPFNKLPIIADVTKWVLSLFDVGYFSSDRLDAAWLTQIASAFDSWKKVLDGSSSSTTYYDAIYKTAKAIAYATGLPVSGALREVITLWNNTAGAADPYLKVRDYESSSTHIDIAETAFEKGDTASVKKAVSTMISDKVKSGKTEKEAKSAVRSSFTSRYKQQYVDAYKRKDINAMNRIRKLLYATGVYGTLTELDKTLQSWRTEE